MMLTIFAILLVGGLIWAVGVLALTLSEWDEDDPHW